MQPSHSALHPVLSQLSRIFLNLKKTQLKEAMAIFVRVQLAASPSNLATKKRAVSRPLDENRMKERGF